MWGAAQAIGFAVGGVLGTAASDLARLLLGSQVAGYSTVFTAEAALFVVSAWLAARIAMPMPMPMPLPLPLPSLNPSPDPKPQPANAALGGRS